jgi:hypothetical protein
MLTLALKQECFSELLIIAEFFLAIPSHNANTERVFSLMKSQWTKERNISDCFWNSVCAA